MWPIVHDATNADQTGAWGRRESIDNRLRVRDGFGRGRERLVDDRHLCRMDRHLARKAVTASFLTFATKACAIAKIDEHCIDRRHARGACAYKAQSARKPIGIEKAALRIAICSC